MLPSTAKDNTQPGHLPFKWGTVVSLKLIAALICVVAAGCSIFSPSSRPQNAPAQRTDRAQKLLEENTSLYFPDRAFTPSGALADKQIKSRIAWLALFLRSIGEPPLRDPSKTDSDKQESYRLVWMGFPAGKFFVLRLAIAANGTAKIFAKETAYKPTPYTEADLVLNQEGAVSSEAVNGFLELVTKAKFWELPTLVVPEPQMPDGSYWYLEGAKPDQHHFVYRRNPESHPDSFTDMGRYLATDLAHLSDSVISIPRSDRSEPIRRQRPQ
jgi:hypothetical protein